MEYFRINVKVGGFILLTLVLLVAAAIMVGNLGSLFAKKHDYTVLLRDASLLPQGSQVSYAGHPVGQVTAVEIRSDAVRAQQHPEYPVAAAPGRARGRVRVPRGSRLGRTLARLLDTLVIRDELDQVSLRIVEEERAPVHPSVRHSLDFHAE